MTTGTSTTTEIKTDEFDETFQRLLEASNLVQRLREIDAEPGVRIAAHTELLHARVDAGKARTQLN